MRLRVWEGENGLVRVRWMTEVVFFFGNLLFVREERGWKYVGAGELGGICMVVIWW